MELSSQLHSLSDLPPRKETPVLTGWEAGWVPVSIDAVAKIPCRESGLRRPDHTNVGVTVLSFVENMLHYNLWKQSSVRITSTAREVEETALSKSLKLKFSFYRLYKMNEQWEVQACLSAYFIR
jgi:hypothetical protein